MVTDPYSMSLATDSKRSQIVNLDVADLKPAEWEELAKPALEAPQDVVIYELHVRDFSIDDSSVSSINQGAFKAFTEPDSDGMAHLIALAEAGLTHVHLLPAFDCATIPESRADQLQPTGDLSAFGPDSEEPQALIEAIKDRDGFNWCYDPFHYTVPEGSYATDPDGVTRILELREMVKALNENGLNVVMDVVYNHTTAGGQHEKSVLDKIVPGYYHRLNGLGAVETSTCCSNTATEQAMMEKLMVDSLVTWAKAYKVDGFRFDLMGHHMKANMLTARDTLRALTVDDDGVDGARIYLYGEGWNFGEVADNARGVNATQLNMADTGIGTFNDRIRDAIHGGGPFDGGIDRIINQGFINGLYYDPNLENSGSVNELDRLLLSADQIRVGLASNLADYVFVNAAGNPVSGAQIDYNGQPAGYTRDPQEIINYASAHDNETLFDISQYKTPLNTSMGDRVRIQNMGLSLMALSQGTPFLHAGSDMLRSKSMDRDSFNSGDWFNALDFTYSDNNWGHGLPIAEKNQDDWPIMRPLLADPDLKPDQSHILDAVSHLREMLAIRKSSPLFRLTTGEAVKNRGEFLNTGPSQIPGLIAMSIADDTGEVDPDVRRVVALFNANDEPVDFESAALAGQDFHLHGVQVMSADLVVRSASVDNASGTSPCRRAPPRCSGPRGRLPRLIRSLTFSRPSTSW